MAEAGESRFYARVFGLVAGGLLALALVSILRPFLESILWAGLLAFLVAPLNGLLTRKLGGRPGLAALLLTMAGALFVLIPAVRSRIIQVLRLDIRVFRLGGVFINFSITYLEKSASCYQHQKIRKAANLFPRFRYWHVG